MNPKRCRKFHQVFFSRRRTQVVSKKSGDNREKKMITETQFRAIVDSSPLMGVDLSESRSNSTSSVLITEH